MRWIAFFLGCLIGLAQVVLFANGLAWLAAVIDVLIARFARFDRRTS